MNYITDFHKSRSGKIGSSDISACLQHPENTGSIAGYEYRKDEGSWINTTETQFTWNLITDGAHTFEVKAIDNDGLYSEMIIWNFIENILKTLER